MSKKHNTSIQMFADFDGDINDLLNTPAPEELPILATRNMVLFPGVDRKSTRLNSSHT